MLISSHQHTGDSLPDLHLKFWSLTLRDYLKQIQFQQLPAVTNLLGSVETRIRTPTIFLA